MTDRLTSEQIDAIAMKFVGEQRAYVELLAAQAKLAAQSPPVAELPPRADLEALTCTATREPEFGNRLKAVLEITDYADKLREAAFGLASDLADEKREHAITVEAALQAARRADGLESENQRLKESFDLLLHDKVTTIERAEAAEAALEIANKSADDQMFQKREAEASAQAERERVREVERDAARYRWLRDGADLDNFPSSVHEAMQQGGEQLDIAIDAALPPSGEG